MGYTNPLLKLEAATAILALPEDAREALADLLTGLRKEANELAEKSWKRRKGPVASYWRVTSTYAGHCAHALRKAGRQTIALEKEGDGRYVVTDASDGKRLGLVMGGGKRWVAEKRSGETIGGFGSRLRAAAALWMHQGQQD